VTDKGLARNRHEGELLEVDARPSDAIAVAVTSTPHLPIYVSEEVLDAAIDPPE
jgi:bifunctional DNase/RNase